MCATLIADTSYSYASELHFKETFTTGRRTCCISPVFLKKYYDANSQDVCILDKALSFFHPNIYFFNRQACLSTTNRTVKKKFAPNLNKQQLTLNIAKFIAQMNDDHSYVSFSKHKKKTSLLLIYG